MQTDFDGTTSFSKVRVVSIAGDTGVVHVLQNYEGLNVLFDGFTGNVEVKMYDIHGKLIKQELTLSQANESGFFYISKNNLTKGVYLISVTDGTSYQSLKFYLR